MPAWDARLMFKSNTNNLTNAGGDFPSAGLKIFGTPVNGLAARVLVPSFPRTQAKLKMDVIASADDSTYHIVAQYPKGQVSGAATQVSQVYMIPFDIPADMPYVKLRFTVATASTSDNFGAAKAGIVHISAQDWKRDAIVSI